MKPIFLLVLVACAAIAQGAAAVTIGESMAPDMGMMPAMTANAEEGTDMEMTADVVNSINVLCKTSAPPTATAPASADVKMAAAEVASAAKSSLTFRRRGRWIRRLRCRYYYFPYWKFCCWYVWWWVWW